MNLTITVNGTEVTAAAAATVGRLLENRAINPDHVVVEINGTIIRREDYDTCTITDGDRIEMLRFVGGG